MISMKTTIRIFLVLTVVLFSCRKAEDEPKITMTTANAELRLSFGGMGSVLINFGDGVTDTISCVDEWAEVTHQYSSEALHTVTITGKVMGLDCEKNRLTTIDVSENPGIKSLYCSENQLTDLDVSKLSGLGNLACNKNLIKNLDVRKLTKLERLFCRNNQLTSLNVSGLNQLDTISCQYNYMNADALNSLFTSLHTSSNHIGQLYVSNNGPNCDGSGTKDCDVTIAENKGWKVVWK